MAAHRYWRILCVTVNDGGIIAAGNIQMRAVVGGPTVTTGGVAFASSAYGGMGPEYAFDADPSSSFACQQGVGGWIGYDFGAGNSQDIVEIVWRARNGGGEATQSPSSIRVQWSDDYSTWTTDYSDTFGPFTDAQSKTARRFNVALGPNKRRYWRVNVTANWGSGVWGGAEMALATVIGGPAVTNSFLFDLSAQTAYSNPFRLFDGSASIYEANQKTGWIQLGFLEGVTLSIEEIRFTAGNDYNEAPKTGAIQYSDDGTTWVEYWTFAFPQFSEGLTQTASNPASGVISTPVSQMGLVVPSQVQVTGDVSDIVLVSVTYEVPPPSEGAQLSQTVIITVSREYTIPPIYIPVPLVQFMQTMPYYIGNFEE